VSPGDRLREEEPALAERELHPTGSAAAAAGGGVVATQADHEEEMPRPQWTRRTLLLALVTVVAIVAFLYFVLPQIAGLDETWKRIERGDGWWLALAAAFTVLSFVGYVMVFQGIYAHACPRRLGPRESYQITMAGLAATRVFAAGGAGGIALTAWALRRAGMPAREVADRSVAFLVITYAFYMAAMLVAGLSLDAGIIPGPAPFSLTVVPAIFALICIILCLLLALTPTNLSGQLEGYASRSGRLGRFAQRAANLPAAMSAGVRIALRLARDRDRDTLLGTAAYWGFNIAVLWASFKAFGASPPLGVMVMAYYVGMLGNLLPLPGGVGGVDGGMIGAFIAFGVDDGLAVVAVLTYRAFAFWLPTIPGAIAYFQLRKTVARWRAAEPAPGYAHA
jgi:uncharacterized protein (TIRG00374 family)